VSLLSAIAPRTITSMEGASSPMGQYQNWGLPYPAHVNQSVLSPVKRELYILTGGRGAEEASWDVASTY
jgi:hypothetical protein